MKRTFIIVLLVAILISAAGCGASSKRTSDVDPVRGASYAPSASSSAAPAPSGAASGTAPAMADTGRPSAAGAAPAGGSTSTASSPGGPTAGGAVPVAPEAVDVAGGGGAMYSEHSMSLADGEYSDVGPMTIIPADDYYDRIDINARPGLLTAGEWNDNKNYDFIMDLTQINDEWKDFEQRWSFNITRQVRVTVFDGDRPVVNAKVELLDENENVIFIAQTDNSGIAYLYNDLRYAGTNPAAYVRASTTTSKTQDFDPYVTLYEFDLPEIQQPKSLDLMLVIDTTGSMSDELRFLKSELDDVIKQVVNDNANIPVRLSINVYRDIGDSYVVRSMPFEKDIDNQLDFLNAQYASGGGDFEEAVELALADAIDDHDWNENSTARIMLLVLDAPPHNTSQIRDEMHRLTEAAAEKGIRIIPVASSGVDKNTEFLLRCLSMATGGTYVFLTDDSGIGESHLEPTIGDYQMELLNEMLVRLLNEYLK